MTRPLRWDITTDHAWQNFSAFRSQAVLAGEKLIVQRVDEKRTLDQNALSHKLYSEIASQLEDQSIEDVRRECKLTIGIPILRSDDHFRALYDKSIKATLDYDEKLECMAWFPVTRLMDKKQFSDYIDQIIRDYSQRGVSIVFPGEAA